MQKKVGRGNSLDFSDVDLCINIQEMEKAFILHFDDRSIQVGITSCPIFLMNTRMVKTTFCYKVININNAPLSPYHLTFVSILIIPRFPICEWRETRLDLGVTRRRFSPREYGLIIVFNIFNENLDLLWRSLFSVDSWFNLDIFTWKWSEERNLLAKWINAYT